MSCCWSCATLMRAGRAFAISSPPPANRMDRSTACCANRAPHCGAAAAPITSLVPARPSPRPAAQIVAAHRDFYQIEDRGQAPGIFAGRQPGHQPVQNQFQVALQHFAGNVSAYPMRFLLAAQPGGGGGLQLRGAFRPAAAEFRVVAQFACDLQPGSQPIELVGCRQHVAHHLDEARTGGDVGHPLGVLVGQREEERVLVAEVVEDRAA